MKKELLLPDSCKICNSKKIKKSDYYPSMYFCKNCKDGGELEDSNKMTKEAMDLLAQFEAMLNE